VAGRDGRTWSWLATGLLALCVALSAPVWTHPTLRWPALAWALGAATLAQILVLRFRQGTRTVLFAWGEAALIIVFYLVPVGVVPLVIGVGVLAGSAVYALRTRSSWGTIQLVGVANLTLAGAAGAYVADLGLPDRPDRVSPQLVAALVAGALTYAVVASALLNVNLVPPSEDIVGGALRTFRGKLPMTGGNILVGLLVVMIDITHPLWLVLLPPVLVLVHQLYVYRSRAADEQRIWRGFADLTRSFNQMDEGGVAVAAVEGVLRLFDASVVEVWVDRLTGPPRGYRGRLAGDRVEVVQLSGAPAARSELPGVRRALSIGRTYVGQLWMRMPDGRSLDDRDEMALTAVAEALAVALHDASANRALQALTERGIREAQYDVLTGVANRNTLLRDGAAWLDTAGPADMVCLYVLGINRFKAVNDTLGPRAGDELLRVTANRLAASIEDDDLLARIGGDEFAVLTLAGDPPDGVRDLLGLELAAAEWAVALAGTLAVPAEIAGLQVAVEASVGVVVAPAGECDMAELVRRGDIAMHRAKRGAGPVNVFDGFDAAPGSVEGLSVLVDMRDALDRDDQLVLAVQPAVELASGRPISAETLVRWRHPRRGLLKPADFVDIVDRSDLVAPFTRYVLGHALRLAGDWAAAGLGTPVPVSVNLSPRSLTDPTLPDDVAELLKLHGVNPGLLILEITESAVAAGLPSVSRVLAALRALGVQLAVDDFGSGYSSLTFLTRVQVDEVKIDASFVGQMITSAEACAIVRTTIDLGRNLGVRVVAEGVETAAQHAVLVGLGCPAAQGHHITTPVDAADSLAVLRDLIERAG
jgi:diguanylate cyclase (GGDEF)-like protein